MNLRHRERVATDPPPLAYEPGELERLTTEQLRAIVRSTPSDPALLTLRERMAWRELALRGSRRPSN